jgi:methyl coenzyme M reductase subunit D
MIRTTTQRVEGVDATARVADGRVAMVAQVTDTLYVETPGRRPLSVHESHCTLRVEADDVRVTIDLDGEGLDALVDALYHAQGGDDSE